MRLGRSVALLSCVLFAAPALAQPECSTWQSMPFASASGPNGANGAVQAMVSFDPDGGGPQAERLVIAGSFTSVQGVAANHVAMRDPVTGQWQPLGSGTDDQIRCLAVYNGELIAGGLFRNAGGQSADYIARWNGTSWQGLGTGTGNSVYALTVYNGELIAGGYFINAGGGTANHVARWNGTSWQALGAGINDWVVSLTVYGTELIAGGYFSSAGGVSANRAARWNGASWQAMGSGMNLEVLALQPYNGGVVAAGRFTSAGGLAANRIAFWNGSLWQTMGSGMDNTVIGLSYYHGELVAGGVFLTAGGTSVGSIARWNGAVWQPLEYGIIGGVYTMFPWAGELVAGGGFSEAGAQPENNLASWNGLEWGSFGGGTSNSVSAMTLYLGRVIAAGDLHQSTANGPPAHFLVGWNGASFNAYGSGLDGPAYSLLSFKYPGVFGSSELVAAGSFTHAGGVAATRVARWNQSDLAFPPPAWQAMGAGFNGIVYALERHSSVTYAGGAFTASGVAVSRIARWNETSDVWEPVGTGMNGTVLALKSYGGYLYAGGSFTTAGGVSTGGLARWDGNTWSSVGGFFLGTVYALEVHNGQLVMGGVFTGINNSPNLAQWNGLSYSTFGTGGTNGAVRCLRSTGARLYVGGEFTQAGGLPASRVAYWDGSWHELQGGTDSNVYAMTYFHGELHAGGAFGTARAGLVVSPRWARYAELAAPWIVTQSGSMTAQLGDAATFSATPASGYDGLAHRWAFNGVPLVDGSTPGGSEIDGAFTPTLTVSHVTHDDYGRYQYVVSNACGSASSSEVTLTPGGTTDAPAPGAAGRSLFEAIGPNPAAGPCQVTFTLAQAASIGLRVHDVTGRLVSRLDAGRLQPGRHQLMWHGLGTDGTRLRAGMYFVTLQADGRELGVRRVAIVR